MPATIFNAPLSYLTTGFDPDHLVRLYCWECERYSRAVRKPTERDRQAAREFTGDPHVIVFPKAPKGWERGCPRCCPVAAPSERTQGSS